MNFNVNTDSLPLETNAQDDTQIETNGQPGGGHNELQIAVEVTLLSGASKKVISVDHVDNLTVESLMQKLYNENREFLKNKSIYDFDFYIANKKGQPKDDYPAIDKSQMLSLVKFNRFVMMSKEYNNASLSKIYEVTEGEETYCFCFKSKPKPVNNHYGRLN